jgi:NAD-dependent deacetylase
LKFRNYDMATPKPKIILKNYSNIVILTGAGISFASGIPTFRDPKDGLYDTEEKIRLSSIDYFVENPLAVCQFWGGFRQKVSEAKPNQGHLVLAQIEQSIFPKTNFLPITQNVDGLHAKAGSKELVEMHGNLLKTKCSNPTCQLESFADTSVSNETVPRSSLCGDYLRPAIVFFGEPVAMDEQLVKRGVAGLRFVFSNRHFRFSCASFKFC